MKMKKEMQINMERDMDIEKNQTKPYMDKSRKEHQRASLQFLSKQLKRLSNIERQLLHITDEASVTDTTSTANTNDDLNGNGNGNTNDSAENIMTMEELSSLCRMLHSHHAKYLIQIEEILHDRFGYVHDSSKNKRQQKQQQKQQQPINSSVENDTNDPTLTEKENTHHNTNQTIQSNNHGNGTIHKRENIIINPLIGQPLNRLSEADIETDIGSTCTRTSCCTPSANSMSTINTTAIHSQSHTHITPGRGSLSSLPPRSSSSSSTSSASSLSSISSPYKNNQHQLNHHQRQSLPYIRNGAIVSPKEILRHSMIETTTTTNTVGNNHKSSTYNHHSSMLDEEKDLQGKDVILESSFSSLKIRYVLLDIVCFLFIKKV